MASSSAVEWELDWLRQEYAALRESSEHSLAVQSFELEQLRAQVRVLSSMRHKTPLMGESPAVWISLAERALSSQQLSGDPARSASVGAASQRQPGEISAPPTVGEQRVAADGTDHLAQLLKQSLEEVQGLLFMLKTTCAERDELRVRCESLERDAALAARAGKDHGRASIAEHIERRGEADDARAREGAKGRSAASSMPHGAHWHLPVYGGVAPDHGLGGDSLDPLPDGDAIWRIGERFRMPRAPPKAMTGWDARRPKSASARVPRVAAPGSDRPSHGPGVDLPEPAFPCTSSTAAMPGFPARKLGGSGSSSDAPRRLRQRPATASSPPNATASHHVPLPPAPMDGGDGRALFWGHRRPPAAASIAAAAAV